MRRVNCYISNQPAAPMKKSPVVSTIVLVSLFALSFRIQPTAEEQTTIKVSAPQPTEFDMYEEGNNISRKLKTPYEFKFTKQNDKFIFKSLDQKTVLKVTFEKEHAAVVMGQWPIVALVIDNGTATTFGID